MSGDRQSSDEEWQVEFELTEQDVVDFNVFHMRNSRMLRRRRRLQLLLRSSILLLLWGLLVITAKDPNAAARDWWPLLFCVPAFLATCALLTFRQTAERRLARGMLHEGRNPNLGVRRRMTLRPDGVAESSVNGETALRWRAVGRIAVAPGAVYLYVTATSAFIVPQRAFADRDALERFAALARRYYAAAIGEPTESA
jgi:hypothetical protein